MGSVVKGNIGAGKLLYPIENATNIRSSYSTNSSVLKTVNSPNPVGTTTGYIYSGAGELTWYQIKNGNTTGWVRRDVVGTTPKKTSNTTSNTSSEDNSESVLKNILSSDNQTYKKLLLAREMMDGNSSVSSDIINRYNSITQSYNKRQNAIKSTEGLNTTTGVLKAGWKYLQDKWSEVISGVGVPFLIPVVCVVVASIVGGYMVYNILKPQEKLAFNDLQNASGIVEELEGVSPEKAEKLRGLIEGATDEAYSKGQSSASVFGDIKNTLLIGGALYFAISISQNNRKK